MLFYLLDSREVGLNEWLRTLAALLRIDLVHRLECLQRIVSKLQMEAGLCEEQLNQADALLQSVRERREAGQGVGWAPLQA